MPRPPCGSATSRPSAHAREGDCGLPCSPGSSGQRFSARVCSCSSPQHWDRLSPPARFALVLLMVATFHVAGALLRDRYAVLGQVLHASGTVSLGAGIYLSGQIFNLQEHWPGAVMLWAAGAWLAWILLRDRIQVAFAALLTPVWLVGEWFEAIAHTSADWSIPAEGRKGPPRPIRLGVKEGDLITPLDL